MCTNERTRRRRRGTARQITGITAITADHSGHGRPRRSRQVTAVTTGRGRAFRTLGHGPGVTNQPRTGRVRVRTAPSGHDLSTAVTAVVTAAAAPPGSRPGAQGAAPTRSSARWLVNGEPGLRGGDRRGGGNHQGGRAGQTKLSRSPAPCRILFGRNFLVSRFRPGNLLFRVCPFGSKSSRPGPGLPRHR